MSDNSDREEPQTQTEEKRCFPYMGTFVPVERTIQNVSTKGLKYILLHDRKFRSKLRQTRLLARGIGARHIYARISDKHLHLYFPGKQKPPPE